MPGHPGITWDKPVEVATDPRVPGLRYPGTSWDNPWISWDKLVEVATDPRVPGLSCPGISQDILG